MQLKVIGTSSPLVTIGIAAYNGESSIPKSIRSALGQSYPNTEIIISDDNSSDTTEKICRSAVQVSNKVSYHRNSQRFGITHNYNLLLERASGEFFVLFDQDDFRDSDFIEKAVSVILSPRVEIAMGRVVALFNGQVMHINSYHKTASKGHLAKRVFCLLRRPSDFLGYGLMRTATLRSIGGWSSGAASFYKLIFELILRGELRTFNSSYYYSAKGAVNRPSKKEELLRNDSEYESRFIHSLFGFLDIPVSYLNVTLKSQINLIDKLTCGLLVLLDTSLKIMIKILIKIILRWDWMILGSRLERMMIYIYHPIDHINFVSDRKSNANGYYHKNWPLI